MRKFHPLRWPAAQASLAIAVAPVLMASSCLLLFSQPRPHSRLKDRNGDEAQGPGVEESTKLVAQSVREQQFSSYAYDVVSIKLDGKSTPLGGPWVGLKETPDGLTAHTSATALIGMAYATGHSKVAPMKGWASDDIYEIEAKMDAQVASNIQMLSRSDQRAARRHMLQVLLRDRFKATIHLDVQEVPGFDLVVGKKGTTLTDITAANLANSVTSPGTLTMRTVSGTTQELVGEGVSVAQLLNQLAREKGRPISDKTGLTGTYNFRVRFTPEQVIAAGDDVAPDAAPPLDKSIETQLGLTLVNSKVKIDLVVVDHIERPSPN